MSEWMRQWKHQWVDEWDNWRYSVRRSCTSAANLFSSLASAPAAATAKADDAEATLLTTQAILDDDDDETTAAAAPAAAAAAPAAAAAVPCSCWCCLLPLLQLPLNWKIQNKASLNKLMPLEIDGWMKLIYSTEWSCMHGAREGCWTWSRRGSMERKMTIGRDQADDREVTGRWRVGLRGWGGDHGSEGEKERVRER